MDRQLVGTMVKVMVKVIMTHMLVTAFANSPLLD
jgi:hypothetical protein